MGFLILSLIKNKKLSVAFETHSVSAGFGLGFRRGRGFMLVKLPRHHHASGSTNRWSAPIFVKVNVGEFGLCFGCAQSRSMLLAMSDKLPHQLIAEKGGYVRCFCTEIRRLLCDSCKLIFILSFPRSLFYFFPFPQACCRHSMLGVDNTFTMFNTATETKSDVISLSSGVSDVAGASVVKGVMLDFSLAGGWLSVDEEKMKNVYGTTPTTVSTTIARSVVSGATPPPPEMMPLYDYINKLIAVRKKYLFYADFINVTADYFVRTC